MGKRSKKKGVIRDKVKRVILVDGTPDVLYKNEEKKLTRVEINGKVFGLGNLQEGFVEELRKIPHFAISQEIISRSHPISIKIEGLGHRVHIKKVNGDTHITVGAGDDSELLERIKIVEKHLGDIGVDYKEKCYWVCSTSKNTAPPELKKDKTEETVKLEEIQEEKKISASEKKEQDKELKRQRLKNIIMKASVDP